MYVLNLKHSPEKTAFGERADTFGEVAGKTGSALGRALTVPPGSQTASSYTTVGKQPGEQRARALGETRKASIRVWPPM